MKGEKMKRLEVVKMSEQFFITPALGITKGEKHYALAFAWLCIGGRVLICHRKQK